jgi:hypothetical protein
MPRFRGKTVSVQVQTWSPEQSLRVWHFCVRIICCANVAAAKAKVKRAARRILDDGG